MKNSYKDLDRDLKKIWKTPGRDFLKQLLIIERLNVFYDGSEQVSIADMATRENTLKNRIDSRTTLRIPMLISSGLGFASALVSFIASIRIYSGVIIRAIGFGDFLDPVEDSLALSIEQKSVFFIALLFVFIVLVLQIVVYLIASNLNAAMQKRSFAAEQELNILDEKLKDARANYQKYLPDAVTEKISYQDEANKDLRKFYGYIWIGIGIMLAYFINTWKI